MHEASRQSNNAPESARASSHDLLTNLLARDANGRARASRETLFDPAQTEQQVLGVDVVVPKCGDSGCHWRQFRLAALGVVMSFTTITHG